MVIFFLFRHKKACKLISEQLEKEGNCCFLFSDIGQFYSAVSNMKKYPDLLILEYQIINHDMFNIYRYLVQIDIPVPLIFYNDPYPAPQDRVKFWKMIFAAYYPAMTAAEIELYTPILTLISKVIDSPEIHPYVPLQQGQEIITGEAVKNTETNSEFIKKSEADDFVHRTHLSGRMFQLFTFLYENRKEPQSVLTLEKQLEKDGKNVPEGNIYTIISRLRQIMLHEKEFRLDIIRTHCGYMLVHC